MAVWSTLLRTLRLSILVGLTGSLMPSALAAEAGRYALVIANSAYQHTTQLANPNTDGRDMAVLLRQLNRVQFGDP